MGDQSTQRKAHRFFSERMATLEAFTKQDLMDASGWSRSSVDTYWSKQFRGLIEDLGDGTYRFKERFRSYLDWKKFQLHRHSSVPDGRRVTTLINATPIHDPDGPDDALASVVVTLQDLAPLQDIERMPGRVPGHGEPQGPPPKAGPAQAAVD